MSEIRSEKRSNKRGSRLTAVRRRGTPNLTIQGIPMAVHPARRLIPATVGAIDSPHRPRSTDMRRVYVPVCLAFAAALLSIHLQTPAAPAQTKPKHSKHKEAVLKQGQ